MYDFLKKTELSKRAKVAHIEAYRAMLAELGNPASGWVSPDKQRLAKDLLYILLDSYTIEEIEARAALLVSSLAGNQPQAAILAGKSARRAADTGSEPVKKKSINTKNILELTGKTWTALKSGLRTVYSRIESAAGTVFKSSKS